MFKKENIVTTSVNTIRLLGIDAIARAKSGHGGIVLGAAPIMYALFHDHLKINTKDPNWFNRDRFILSAGHGSALLYSTMAICGYPKPTIADLKNFRQIDSICTGHPERNKIDGIDLSTGPLGQGCGASVGFAIAEKHLSSIFNKYSNVVDHYTYVLCGDGCLEEGISHEAIAIAGRYKLNKLIWLYDSNNVQLDGRLADSTAWNVKNIFKAHNWNYIKTNDNPRNISKAIAKAKKSKSKPTIIEVSTIIGLGSEKADTNKAHSLVPNVESLKKIHEYFNCSEEEFYIPLEVKEHFEKIAKRTKIEEAKYYKNLEILKENDIELYNLYNNISKNKFNFEKKWFDEIPQKDEVISTRKLLGIVTEEVFSKNKTFMITNPDISSSTYIKTGNIKFNANDSGQNIDVGVREFVATDIILGLGAHGGVLGATSTFLAFVDYAKAAIRLAAVNDVPILCIYSHDSLTLGPDGPTHQPIEQISSLRCIPNHYTFRPCNIEETFYAFDFFINKCKASCVTIIGSRGEFKHIHSDHYEYIAKGGYILRDNNKYDFTLVCTGSEVGSGYEVLEILKKNKINGRLVSMPCMELFKEQTESYKKNVLGQKPIISFEMGSTQLWHQIADYCIGVDTFGSGGGVNDVLKKYNMLPEQVAKNIISYLKCKKK